MRCNVISKSSAERQNSHYFLIQTDSQSSALHDICRYDEGLKKRRINTPNDNKINKNAYKTSCGMNPLATYDVFVFAQRVFIRPQSYCASLGRIESGLRARQSRHEGLKPQAAV